VKLLTKGGQFEYDKRNELLTWSMVNAAVVRNSFEEIKVDKKPGARFKRIDPVDAFIDAHALMLMSTVEPGGNVEEEVGNALTDYLAFMARKSKGG
jgi:phage terminase large subunit-like protein